jgi:hypothetical protein
VGRQSHFVLLGGDGEQVLLVHGRGDLDAEGDVQDGLSDDLDFGETLDLLGGVVEGNRFLTDCQWDIFDQFICFSGEEMNSDGIQRL